MPYPSSQVANVRFAFHADYYNFFTRFLMLIAACQVVIRFSKRVREKAFLLNLPRQEQSS